MVCNEIGMLLNKVYVFCSHLFEWLTCYLAPQVHPGQRLLSVEMFEKVLEWQQDLLARFVLYISQTWTSQLSVSQYLDCNE